MKSTTRLATETDAARIAAIYSQGIAERIATFETEPRSATEIAKQLRDKGVNSRRSWLNRRMERWSPSGQRARTGHGPVMPVSLSIRSMSIAGGEDRGSADCSRGTLRRIRQARILEVAFAHLPRERSEPTPARAMWFPDRWHV